MLRPQSMTVAIDVIAQGSEVTGPAYLCKVPHSPSIKTLAVANLMGMVVKGFACIYFQWVLHLASPAVYVCCPLRAQDVRFVSIPHES